jgi:hypothetical protein
MAEHFVWNMFEVAALAAGTETVLTMKIDDKTKELANKWLGRFNSVLPPSHWFDDHDRVAFEVRKEDVSFIRNLQSSMLQ